MKTTSTDRDSRNGPQVVCSAGVEGDTYHRCRIPGATLVIAATTSIWVPAIRWHDLFTTTAQRTVTLISAAALLTATAIIVAEMCLL
jgi:hypothetical protein